MKEKLIPAIRIDGGKRVDLKARRERRGVVVAAREYARPKPAKLPRPIPSGDGGKDGAVEKRVKVKDLQGQRSRTLTQTVRCRPGTFEWRYGRDRGGPLFHAGSHFAQLWERAGIAVASSADFLRGTSSGYATGISDGRVVAMEALADAVREMGRYSTERLIDYCVLGVPSTDLAHKHGQPARDMAAVLHQDLRAAAMHFRFL